ncbi:MAG: hypothetical protein P4L22_04020 [Candidatus Babeliales bacterium]|nr:hypothetical protein [Candidatus Babeliales bacterium]
MKKLLILALLTLNLVNANTGNLYINSAEQFIKKSSLPTSIRTFMEKKLDLTLNESDILTEISVCDCSCHDFHNTSCPAYPKYLPLSLFIDKNIDGSFKLNPDGTLKFKKENDKISVTLKERNDLVKATLCLKQLICKNQKIEHTLQLMYLAFKKQNPGYAESFENPKNSKLLLAKLGTIQRLSRNSSK